MKIIQVIILFFVFVFVPASITSGQNMEDAAANALENLFSRLWAGKEDSVKLRINDSIRLNVERLAASDNIFGTKFANLKWLGQITSPDSTIKILTWNLLFKKEPGRYFCYLIKGAAAGAPNRVYCLEHGYDPEPIRTDTIYVQSDWYGALYYDIRPVHTGSTKSWILLGINYSDPFTTKKIIDVLSFAPDNNIIFGKKWFLSDSIPSFRYVLKYSSTAIISMRFTSDTSIVFDHLVPLPVESGDGELHFGPDYSSDAFIFREGRWELSINVDARNEQR